ncbi:MAG TPA: hypothetical protein VK791_03130 [bacterium]|jgi:hypothetical protein|nr:hypothetical protein [bacterium]
METLPRSSKSLWIIVLTSALIAGTLGFTLSYQDEQTRFSQMASIAESHLSYAAQLKDDMALIDWSKGLEKLPSILAFRANLDTKVLAEGGNKQFCPATAPNGVSFEFPYRWVIHWQKDSTMLELTLVFQNFRGPLFWALCAIFICLGTGWGLISYLSSPKTLSSSTQKIAPIKKPSVLNLIVETSNDQSFTLALDKDYVICQVTPLAARALDKQVSELVGSHFLDLLPDPSVMKAIDEAKEIKLIKPFPSHPHLSALLQPAAHGTVLILEPQQGSETA